MGAKYGKPAPGVRRGMTMNESIASGVRAEKGYEVAVRADGRTEVWRKATKLQATFLAYPVESQEVELLEAFWAGPAANPIHRSSGLKRPTGRLVHPYQRIIATRPAKMRPLWVVDELECGHEVRRPRKAKSNGRRRCTTCPAQEATP